MRANEYQLEASRTERINWANSHGPDIARLGIIGEAGSFASVIKKHQRDDAAYANYSEHFIEEAGDVLWYVVTIASRLGIKLDDWPAPAVYQDAFVGFYSLYEKIFEISTLAVALKSPSTIDANKMRPLIRGVLADLGALVGFHNLGLGEVARYSCDKNLSYWCKFEECPARIFDSKFPWYEQLPREFEIEFHSIGNDSLIMVMDKIQVGDRLTDNSHMDDGYRFHDVFHIANLACLGWSPVFRAALKRKRKSDGKIDAVEDGARAAIVEEALVNHIYDYARPKFLEGMERVDLDLIKRIQNLVRGYEVSECEAWEWQHCILESYRVFRLLKEHDGGRLTVSASRRRLEFLPPTEIN